MFSRFSFSTKTIPTIFYVKSNQAVQNSSVFGDFFFAALRLSLDCYFISTWFNFMIFRQKKKRSYGFATFKKKLIGKRRHTKGSDHGRCFREHFLDCPSDILKSLLGQYEALTMLKDLSVQADLARPPAKTLGQSLGDLFDTESCCDIVLVYHDRSSSSQRSSSDEVRIAAHKSILMARCPYFSRHLAFHSAEEFHVRTVSSVPLLAIRSVLKYLYTGNTEQLTQEQGGLSVQEETISMLEEEFGVPNSLESDVSFLLETLSLGDLKLVFDDVIELLCHRTIVAARSPFLSRVISKKAATNSKSVLEIKLDSEIIPCKYAKVLLHAIYLDNLDFRLIEQASDLADNQVQDAINLYEIGRFLEFHFLSQACEDMLMQLMSIDNVVQILSWSLNSHGSAWVGRQAQQYLEEEFFNVALHHCGVLASLNQETIVRILKSDFTQGSESEILQALIKWGEVQLKQQEQQFHHDQQSRQRRHRDVCDGELKDLLSSIIDKVRVPHILSKDRTSEALDMALQRNLFAVLPNFSSQVNVATKYSPWDPRSTSGLYVRPRLFLPYFEECKKLIQDRCAQDPEIIASNSPCVSVPDTLYMLKAKHFHGSNEDLLEFQSTKVPGTVLTSILHYLSIYYK